MREEECPCARSISCGTRRNYFIDGIYWGDDEEGVILYLRAKVYPLSHHEALEAVAQAGGYLIQQGEIRQPSSQSCEGLTSEPGTLCEVKRKAQAAGSGSWGIVRESFRVEPPSHQTVHHDISALSD